MQQTTCLVVNPITVDGYASLFNYTSAIRASDSMTASSLNFNLLVGAWRYVFGLARRGSPIGFHLLWHTVDLPWVLVFVYHCDLFDFLCFRFDALTELGAFLRTEFLCVSVLRVASGPRVKLASCKSALNQCPTTPVVCSTDRSKAVVPVLVLLFVALWFIIRGDLFYVLPFVSLFLCFQSF